MTGKQADAIRVLLVDDSVVVRGAIGKIVDAEPDLTVVTTAPNGRVALDALRQLAVDVVVLDIEMPEMDGLTALPQIVRQYPQTRVVMASSLTKAGAEVTLRAMMLGAADFIAKPSSTVGTAGLAVMAQEIASKIRAIGRAARSRAALRTPVALPGPSGAGAAPTQVAPVSTALLATRGHDSAPRILAIASSTGGPNALAEVLSGLPRDFPLPIVITQHMPPVFTTMLAQRIERDAGRPTHEARDGMLLQAGHTYVAPGDFHMLVRTLEGQPLLKLSEAAPENYCRPSADPMFRSVAALYGPSCLAVVLTGMGDDGAKGCQMLHGLGAHVIVQDEATSVVWGMPGAVVSAGAASAVLPLSKIAPAILSHCGALTP